ncbi:hypothetical protein KP509_22G040000 [Ceratopteris richardii]|nr:hypothetical protein KP509_22G040000 [Ceratopteris richardii]
MLNEFDNGKNDEGTRTSLQELPKPGHDEVSFEESESQDFSNHQVDCVPAMKEKASVVSVNEEAEPVDTNSYKKSFNEDCTIQLGELAAFQSVQDVENLASETSEHYSNNELGTHVITSTNGVGQSYSGNETPTAAITVDAENPISNMVKDFDFHVPSDDDCEVGAAPRDLDDELNESKVTLSKSIQQYHKSKFKLLSKNCLVSEEPVVYQKSKPSKLSTSGTVSHDGAQVLNERQTISKQVRNTCMERDSVEVPVRSERHCRNGDDSSFTGLAVDALVPQVCPVCLNFTSTSNTALNAHIDHCLESVLPDDKDESRTYRHRVKPRKMRSMVDICATAPTRTLEDLEQSSRLWMLTDEAARNEASCSLNWTSGSIRRQPRTSIHRGLGWRTRTNLGINGIHRLDIQREPEIAHERSLILEQSGKDGSTHNVNLPSKSCEDQGLPEEPSGEIHQASPVNVEQGLFGVKKKKRCSSIEIFTKENLLSDCSMPLQKEDENKGWDIPFNILDFTIIDTSVEEEKRVLHQIKRLDEANNQVEEPAQEGSVNGVKSNTDKVNHQSSKSSVPDTTSKKVDKYSIENKQLHSPVDSEETSDQNDVVVSLSSPERPAKHKKAALKIKSLLTVVANSCKERLKEQSEEHAFEKTSEEEGFALHEAANSGLESRPQEIFKRSHPYFQENTNELCHEQNKRIRTCPEQCTSAGEFHSHSISGHCKSPKQSSSLQERAVIGQERPNTSCSLQEASLGCSNGHFLSSRLSLAHISEAEENSSSNHTPKKRNVVFTPATTTGTYTKAVHSFKEKSGTSEHGASLCRSRFDFLKKPPANANHKEVHLNNVSEVPRRAAIDVDKIGKSGISECFTHGNSRSTSSFGGLGNFNSTESDLNRDAQLADANRSAVLPENLTGSVSIAGLGNGQHFHDNVSALDFASSNMRESKISRSNPSYSSMRSSASGIKFLRDNRQPPGSMQPSSSGIKLLRDNRQLQVAPEVSENAQQNNILRGSAKHGASYSSFKGGDSFERLPLNSRQSIDNGNHNFTNRITHVQSCQGLVEALQRPISCSVNAEMPQEFRQIHLTSRIPSSESSSMVTFASESPHDNRNIGNYDHHFNYRTMSSGSSEGLSLPSGLLTDLTRTVVMDSRKSKEMMQQRNHSSSQQQRPSQILHNYLPKHHTKASEYSNLLHSHGTRNLCTPLSTKETVQPQVLHTAMQALKTNAPTINLDSVNGTRGSVDVQREVHCRLQPISAIRSDPSNTCINGTRESFFAAELASNFGDIESADYPVDQGVVHIMGSPVFKLMGQNVIVTNNSIKALGSCDQNGVQRFHPSASTRHLGIFSESQKYYVHNVNSDLYPSSCPEACHESSCIPRSRKFIMDNSQVSQSLPANRSGYCKTPVYKDPVITKPQLPMCITGEGSRNPRSGREMSIKSSAMFNSGSQACPGIFVNESPSLGSSFCTGVKNGSGMGFQQNGRQFIFNSCSTPQNQQKVGGFGLQTGSVTFLEDIQRLDSNLCGTRYKSGTLADIVQSSEMGNT